MSRFRGPKQELVNSTKVRVGVHWKIIFQSFIRSFIEKIIDFIGGREAGRRSLRFQLENFIQSSPEFTGVIITGFYFGGDEIRFEKTGVGRDSFLPEREDAMIIDISIQKVSTIEVIFFLNHIEKFGVHPGLDEVFLEFNYFAGNMGGHY